MPRGSHHIGQLFRRVRRSDLSSELADLIFGASPDEVVGPIADRSGYAIVKVLQTTSAILDSATSQTIEAQLFQEWLAERRKAAMVEWYWGRSRATAHDSTEGSPASVAE